MIMIFFELFQAFTWLALMSLGLLLLLAVRMVTRLVFIVWRITVNRPP